MDNKPMESVSTFRACDWCLSGRGEFDTGVERDVIGGDGKKYPVMLCARCFNQFKLPLES